MDFEVYAVFATIFGAVGVTLAMLWGLGVIPHKGHDTQTSTPPTPPAPTETDGQKSVKERDEAFAAMRAEENLATAAAYRDAAQRMRDQRIARLQPGGSQTHTT